MGRPKEVLAYTAGLFDGEGQIYVATQNVGGKCRNTNKLHRLEAAIINTDLNIINWLVDTFGGYISKHAKQCGNTSESWRWRISCDGAVLFLEQILPYLRIKKEQASLAIEFGKLPRVHGKKLTDQQVSERTWFKETISSLAQRNRGKK